jgi:hypothetical protein
VKLGVEEAAVVEAVVAPIPGVREQLAQAQAADPLLP